MAKFKDFEEFRAAILAQGEAAKWCDSKEATMRAIDSYDKALQLVHENPRECFDTGLLHIDIIARIPNEILERNKIYLNEDCDSGLGLITKGKAVVSGDALGYAHNDTEIVAIENAKIRVYDTVKVIAKDSTKIRSFGNNEIIASGSCFVIKEGEGIIKASGSVIVASYNMSGIELTENARFKKLTK